MTQILNSFKSLDRVSDMCKPPPFGRNASRPQLLVFIGWFCTMILKVIFVYCLMEGRSIKEHIRLNTKWSLGVVQTKKAFAFYQIIQIGC